MLSMKPLALSFATSALLVIASASTPLKSPISSCPPTATTHGPALWPNLRPTGPTDHWLACSEPPNWLPVYAGKIPAEPTSRRGDPRGNILPRTTYRAGARGFRYREVADDFPSLWRRTARSSAAAVRLLVGNGRRRSLASGIARREVRQVELRAIVRRRRTALSSAASQARLLPDRQATQTDRRRRQTRAATGSNSRTRRFAPTGPTGTTWRSLPSTNGPSRECRSPTCIPQEHRVVFAGHTEGMAGWAAFNKGYRYFVENVREALGEPGQWYLDRPAGELTYVPRPGEEAAKTVVVAPRLARLLVFEGDTAARRWVQHLQFRGLTFAHANWMLPPGRPGFPQAEVGPGSAVAARRRGTSSSSVAPCATSAAMPWPSAPAAATTASIAASWSTSAAAA